MSLTPDRASADSHFTLGGDEGEITSAGGQVTDLWMDDENTEFEFSWDGFGEGVDEVDIAVKIYRYDWVEGDAGETEEDVDRDPDEFPDEGQEFGGDDPPLVMDDVYDAGGQTEAEEVEVDLEEFDDAGSQVDLIDDGEDDAPDDLTQGEVDAESLSVSDESDSGLERRNVLHFQLEATFRDTDGDSEEVTHVSEGVVDVVAVNEDSDGSTDGGTMDLEGDGE